MDMDKAASLDTHLRDAIRRRRERISILVLILVVAAVTVIETQVVDLGMELPVANSILVFALININALLILVLIFLIARNIVYLVMERRSKVMGASLKTKLVVAFMALSLIPTGVLFFVTIQFINTSMEYWFDISLERSLKDSLQVGRLYYQTSTQSALGYNQTLTDQIRRQGLLAPDKSERLKRFVETKRKEYQLTSLKIYSPQTELLADASEPKEILAAFTSPDRDLITEVMSKGEPLAEITASPLGDYLSAVTPILTEGDPGEVVGAVALARLTPAGLMDKLNAIARGLEDYTQLDILRGPIKLSHYVTLSLVSLVIIFAATWFGFRLARGITVPLQNLAEGTQRIAAGDYNFAIEARPSDEIGTLIDSFNQMTLDLKGSKEELERTNQELIRTNEEIERRRRYMETVLANIAAGVVSTDAGGTITTINRSAEEILGLEANQALGRPLSEILDEDQRRSFEGLSQAVEAAPSGQAKRQIRLAGKERTVSLLVRLTTLADDRKRNLGSVVVIEDMTELEKAQRMAAWREVARRIAHEIKNPLTPIKLSAQRLERRFGEEIKERQIFQQAVGTIIQEVDALKTLVDEFSSFARMPAANPDLGDINQIAAETVRLFQEAHKTCAFELVVKNPPPPFYFDADQMKRVFFNLLDNAVAAVGGESEGRISVRINYLSDLDTVRLEVADSGSGINPEARERLFEPYFSTKKQGSGLGLAIVSTIIQDHNGYIRVQDNAPRGTKFIIELPVSGWSGKAEV